MKRWIAIPGLLLLLAIGSSLIPPGSRVDHGRWRVVVLQSDDWGLEGWVPDAQAAAQLPELAQSAPDGLASYARSTLESAADIEGLADFLFSFSDLDGLPPILQANTIVAALDQSEPVGEAVAPAFGFGLHPPGDEASRYARPDLWRAVARAESLGVWRAELHGLSHFDLQLLRVRADEDDALYRRARAVEVFTADGIGRSSELGHSPAERDRLVVAEACRRFRELFDRHPVSTIAPDYRWSATSEDAWRAEGLRVVQAKAEQRDPASASAAWTARLRKRWRATNDRRRGDFLYLDRVARLEPYGDPEPSAAQGARRAYEQIRGAWSRGEPGIVSIHRLQLVHLDDAVADAGRSQLRHLFELLERGGGARYLVDGELEQLERSGTSWLRRGDSWVVRNFSSGPRRVQLPDRELPIVVPPGVRRIEPQGGTAGNPAQS